MNHKKQSETSDYLSEKWKGWTYANVKCGNCGYEWIAVFPEDTPIDMLQCKNCGLQGMTKEVEE